VPRQLDDRGRADASRPSAARRFDVNPDRSVLLVDARSSVGPITFGALGVVGTIDATFADGRLRPEAGPVAQLEVRVDQLRSGNGLYDAELMRRIEGNRYPVVELVLRDCEAIGSTSRYRVRGDVTCHGTTRTLEGSIEVVPLSPTTIVIRGEQTLDIRDFGVASPTVLMLRIYPDVVVKIQIEAEVRHEEEA
jgi:polyisoprenoid-binding protein YceI